eukprot:PhF_6_TR14125/c0_g1_i1/m.22583/K04371/MAPK1_3; mitogen-activated protein kinase 1/3
MSDAAPVAAPLSPSVGPYKSVLQYRTVTNQQRPVTFTCTDDYYVFSQIGCGTYGVVCKAKHADTGADVAIKQMTLPVICRPNPPHLSEFELFACRTLREIWIVQFLSSHISRSDEFAAVFLEIKDILQMRTKDVKEVHLVTQLMPTDLASVLTNRRQEISIEQIQYIMYNLLRSVNYLHSAHIVHRDIKPQNVLIDDGCEVVLCDFGLARGISDDDQTVYVETRWYRAPELLMGFPTYNEKVDIWSLGCVMAELMMPTLSRRPLWQGRDTVNQLDLILETIGVPTAESIQNIGTPASLTYINNRRSRNDVPTTSQLELVFPPESTDPQALDLLRTMLTFSPNERASAAECLAHPFFAGCLTEGDVHPVCPETYRDRHNFEFLHDPNTSYVERGAILKQMLYDEMLKYHPELKGHDPDVELSVERQANPI